jgi:hypothetical protein
MSWRFALKYLTLGKMRYNKRNKKLPDTLSKLLEAKKATVIRRDGFEVTRGYTPGRLGIQPTAGWAQPSYLRSGSYYGSPYIHGHRMRVVKKEENESARVFEFSGMRFEVHTQEKGELDLQHIKVIIPDNPSRNAEIIHQFNVLNKVRYRKLRASDFHVAYEREVVDRYMQLQPDEREVVFSLLSAEFNDL